uniref:Thioredoxin-related protein n=1 Tax=uncultured Thiotrichaceae bacterium TaxID=298394 RepID=A0A6S6SEE9_9GAMM|nr:MAG: Thioredoxin-related protein [uncultured Thiotrichaceae bacterium]
MVKPLTHHLKHALFNRTIPALLLLVTAFSTPLHSAPLQEADNFEELGQIMREKNIPLLLAFEAEHCNFCTRLKAEHLQPMNNNAGYTKRILIRTIQMDGGEEITGFNGEKTSPAKLSNKYKTFLTPTMLFLNDKGEEVTERMLGYNSPDYFGLYLDQAIDAAEKTINENEK